MLDHILDAVLLTHLKTIDGLAALNGYTGQDNAEHKLPALTVSTTTPEALAGSDLAFKGEVDVIIESEAHDTAPAAHAARVESARAALADRPVVIAALNADFWVGMGTALIGIAQGFIALLLKCVGRVIAAMCGRVTGLPTSTDGLCSGDH